MRAFRCRPATEYLFQQTFTISYSARLFPVPTSTTSPTRLPIRSSPSGEPGVFTMISAEQYGKVAGELSDDALEEVGLVHGSRLRGFLCVG